MSREIIRSKDFAADSAQFLWQQARHALAERNEFRIALSGGNTPRPVYSEFARIARDLPWPRIFFTFSDERCVPPVAANSNFRMANEALFLPANIPENSIARMRGEIEPRLAAQEYQDQLDLLATQHGEKIYRHDLLLLGLGDDGHTASLFAGTAGLEEKTQRVMANFVPKLGDWRLTFTLPLIQQARRVCFLVNSDKHADLIEKVWNGDSQLPAARVDASAAEVTWVLGEAN